MNRSVSILQWTKASSQWLIAMQPRCIIFHSVMLQNNPASLFRCNGACLAVFSSLQADMPPDSRLPWTIATDLRSATGVKWVVAAPPWCMATQQWCVAKGLRVVTSLSWCIATQQWRMPTGSGSLHCSNGALQLNNGALQYVFVIHSNGLWHQLAGINP